MSRSDGSFPEYVKLKIDLKNPPEDMWDRGSRICQKCAMKWPGYAIFQPSPCCAAPTVASPEDPQMTWGEAVRGLLRSRFERYYAKWNEDVSDEALLWDESIVLETTFPLDEEALNEGMEEIERIIGERPKTSTE